MSKLDRLHTDIMLTKLKNSITLPSMEYRMSLIGTADSCKVRGQTPLAYNGFAMLVPQGKSIRNVFSTSKEFSHTVMISPAHTKLNRSRRDGSPFLNLLMMAPLMDSKGKVRYFIGAQVDVSGLLKECSELEAMQRLLRKIEHPGVVQGSSRDVQRQ